MDTVFGRQALIDYIYCDRLIEYHTTAPSFKALWLSLA